MISIIDPQPSVSTAKSTATSTVPFRILSRAITGNPGDFSLVLVCCNSPGDRDHIFSLVKEIISAQIDDVNVPSTTRNLLTVIEKSLGRKKPEAVMVKGLETVKDINQLIISTNLMRDEFRKRFSFPLVLWVNDDILRKLVKLAPDLKDWAAVTIRFDQGANQLVAPRVMSA